MGEIVVKHFKRSGVGSDDKELITEIVVESSDTGRFLQRVEESRLTRPCFQTIDMRGRVAGECHRYAFNDRVHYLDDLSFQLFEQGLRQHNGVYTVGTFEAIMGCARTLQDQQTLPEESERPRGEVGQRRREGSRAVASGGADGSNRKRGLSERDAAAARVDNPDLLPLGYFRRRSHPRLRYACAVVLQRGNFSVNGITGDISVSGVRVHVKGLIAFKRDQEVLLSYPGLENEAGKIDVMHIAYRIVSSEKRNTETVLCLQRSDPDIPAGFSGFLEAFIERYQRDYKLDANDEYQSLLSWYYERCYAQSATQIPFYVEQHDVSDLRVRAVAMSEGNSYLTRFFCTDADNYNFTPICLPHRLQQLRQKRSFVMAMYRQRGEQDQCMRIHSAADFEFSSRDAFRDMVSYTMGQPDHCVVKVQVSQVPAVSVSEQKLDEVSQRLRYKSETQMVELRERLQKMCLVGCIIDMTQAFQQLTGRPGGFAAGRGELAAWVGSEYRCLASGTVKDKLAVPPGNLRPELIRFGYVERRREDRYLAETRVDVSIGGQVYAGLSKDISTRGMRIQLEKCVEVKKSARVKVGLVSLQPKKSGTNLMDIPYRVVQTRDGEEGTVLMLERILAGKRKGLKEFFDELIARNQHKLGIDIGDIWGATTSRVYEALLAANTPTVPFFLACNSEGGAHLQFVGVPESSGSLLDYFSNPGGAVDFRCLNERRVVRALYDAVQILLRQSSNSDDEPTPFELDMYLYKECDKLTGEALIHAATDLDFPTDARREAFLAKFTRQPDWRCIRIVSTFTQPMDEKTLDKMVDSLRSQSKHRAIKLSDLAHSLVGYGELIDITDEWPLLRS
ncbi:MAG: PilZ domain-containing protein [Thiogranum sp.]